MAEFVLKQNMEFHNKEQLDQTDVEHGISCYNMNNNKMGQDVTHDDGTTLNSKTPESIAVFSKEEIQIKDTRSHSLDLKDCDELPPMRQKSKSIPRTEAQVNGKIKLFRRQDTPHVINLPWVKDSSQKYNSNERLEEENEDDMAGETMTVPFINATEANVKDKRRAFRRQDTPAANPLPSHTSSRRLSLTRMRAAGGALEEDVENDSEKCLLNQNT